MDTARTLEGSQDRGTMRATYFILTTAQEVTTDAGSCRGVGERGERREP